ncbi:type I-C CRISPR-associated protein Cas8c/Csd1 [Ectothiorhodospiraceae bacterium BW-2]|nr:type I-C CRISPR-associated protein Cas8c/Csd1 [Ectothiorhodospiraceae bacterium BW-2]
MILQALCDYYERKRDELPKYGFENKKIPFVIVIDENGQFISLEDTREMDGKRKVVREFLVPKLPQTRKAKDEVVRSGLTAGIAIDHFGYVAGQAKCDKKTKGYLEKDVVLAKEQLAGFQAKTDQLAKILLNDSGVKSLARFYQDEANLDKLKQHESWNDVVKQDGTMLAFRLAGCAHLVCQSHDVIRYIESETALESDGFCLLKGDNAKIARIHSVIKVKGSQESKPKTPRVVSFNQKSFESLGKSQSYNSPIGELASFQYSTALNHLLSGHSQNSFHIGDMDYLFWSEKRTPLENTFSAIFGYSDNPDSGTEAVKSLFQTIHNGAYTAADGQDRFYLLALAPNSARIMVRLWQNGTVAEFAENLAQWFHDLDIVGRDHYGYPPLIRLLRATALKGEDKHLSPRLPADLLRAILLNQPLPISLVNALLYRMKIEKCPKDKNEKAIKDNLDFLRTSAIKAWLNRQNRYNPTFKEVTVSLNPEEDRPGYLLGRLFALLEKLQQDANPGLNATIRDRYYSSASTTPQSVFATLMRLHTHHLKKIENPKWRGSMEKRIGEVMAKIQQFPSHLNLENQGLFAIGYYHQRQHLFSKNTTSKESQHESE